jgi:uncharacterized membrane protein
MTAPMYIPLNSVKGSFFSILTNICYLLAFLIKAILASVRWYLIVVLLCISLINSLVYLLYNLLDICMSSFDKY